MKISVIVPVYNVEKYINECLQSIIQQTYKNLEIILVNDGSIDTSGNLCDLWAQQDKRIKVVHQKNQGLSAARNTALDLCTGEIIAFVDSDDWLEPTAYEKMINFLIEKDLDIVFCGVNRIYENKRETNQFIYYPDRTILSPQEVLKRTLKNEIESQVWLKIYRKHCWNNLRFPVGRLYEDLPVSFFTFANAQKEIGFLTECFYNYRINSNGISLSNNPLKNYHIFLGMLEHYEYAKKHFGDIVEYCLIKACAHAFGVLNNYYKYKWKKFNNILKHIDNFIKENKSLILKCKQTPKKLKIQIKIYSCSKKLYAFITKIKNNY